MPKAFPPEFRRDVVAVARKGEAPLRQVAKDFGISEACLHRWLKIADTDDGIRPGTTTTESAELRELRKRNKLLEQENEILRRAAAYFAISGLCAPFVVAGAVHEQPDQVGQPDVVTAPARTSAPASTHATPRSRRVRSCRPCWSPARPSRHPPDRR